MKNQELINKLIYNLLDEYFVSSVLAPVTDVKYQLQLR